MSDEVRRPLPGPGFGPGRSPLVPLLLAGAMAALAASAVPGLNVVPGEIGLDTVLALAGAFGTVGYLVERFGRGRSDERWVGRFTAAGLSLGVAGLVFVAGLHWIFDPA